MRVLDAIVDRSDAGHGGVHELAAFMDESRSNVNRVLNVWWADVSR